MHPDRTRVGKLVLRGVALLVCGLSVGAVCPPVGFASDLPNWSAGVEVQLPEGTAPDPLVSLGSVSCASSGNCGAVGVYKDGSGIQQGLLVSQSAGGPPQAVEAQLPGDAASDPNVSINSVSCPSAGNCAAVGHYTIGSQGAVRVLLFSESAGVWASGTEAQLPAGAVGATLGVDARSVVCESAGNCTAVGSYVDAAVHAQGLLLSESGGAWATGIKAQAPGDANGNPGVVISSLSCTSIGNCAAVGSYSDGSGDRQALLLSESGGVWAPGVRASLPADANAPPAAFLSSVSCGSTGDCTAIGGYSDSSGATQGLLVSESGGVWEPGVKAPLPPGAAANPAVIISSVSCASAGACAAVGFYQTASSPQGLLLSESGGVWSTAEAAVPAGGLGAQSLESVSCPSVGACAAGGTYADSLPSPQGLLLSESGGVWATGVQPQAPAGAAPSPGPQISVTGVSCAAVGACTAVGGYFAGAGAAATHQALLLTATPAAPDLALAAPATSGVGRELAASSLTATLSGGLSPTGSASFRVFGPQPLPPASCTSGGTVVGTAPVSGNGVYHPPTSFTPTAAGNYWWYASYGGDTSDLAKGSPCGPSMAETIVEPAPSIALSAPATGFIGVAVGPSATVAGGASLAGPLSFRVFGPQGKAPASCASGGRVLRSAAIAGDGVYHPPTGFTPRKVGDYWWYASYGGDTSNLAAASTCGASMPKTAVGRVQVSRARVAGNSATVAVRCIEIVACRVTLSLTATETTRGSRLIAVGKRAGSGPRAQPRKRQLVVLRSTTVLIRALRHRTVPLVLDRAGGRILARFGRLRARLTVKQPARTWSMQTVTFKQHRRHSR